MKNKQKKKTKPILQLVQHAIPTNDLVPGRGIKAINADDYL